MTASTTNTSNIWIEKYPIRFYEVGSDKKLTVPNLCNFIQNSSANHVDHLGVGISHLNELNYTWILSRLTLSIQTMPKWKEMVNLSTWHVCKHKLFAVRDYQLEDARGKKLVRGTASWLIIDKKRRRPVSCKNFLHKMQPSVEQRALTQFAEKVDALPREHSSQEIKVSSSDIDINGHVNNVKYLEWFFNQMDTSPTPLSGPMNIEINFLGESFWGATLKVSSHLCDQEYCWSHSLIDVNSGAELCRAKVKLLNKGHRAM